MSSPDQIHGVNYQRENEGREYRDRHDYEVRDQDYGERREQGPPIAGHRESHAPPQAPQRREEQRQQHYVREMEHRTRDREYGRGVGPYGQAGDFGRDMGRTAGQEGYGVEMWPDPSRQGYGRALGGYGGQGYVSENAYGRPSEHGPVQYGGRSPEGYAGQVPGHPQPAGYTGRPDMVPGELGPSGPGAYPGQWQRGQQGGVSATALGGYLRGQRGQHTGRGPKGYRRSDERILEDVCERLTEHGELDASDIEVTVNGGEVTLKGTVESKQAKRLAEDIADDASGVLEVHNQLRVRRDNREAREYLQSETGPGPTPTS